MARARAGGPEHERRMVGRRQPGNGGAGSHTREAGEEREGRERVGWPVGRSADWGPVAERKAGGVSMGGPARRWGPTSREREGGGAADMQGRGV
jgi:hypothetical protein